MIDIEHIEQSVAGLPLVGYTVFWSLNGIAVQHADLADRLRVASIAHFLPEPPTYRKALRRALVAWIEQRGTFGYRPLNVEEDDDDEEEAPRSGRLKRALIRVINTRGAEAMVFALVAENVDFAALGLTYGTDLRIQLEKKSGALICTTTARGRIDAANEVKGVYQQLVPFWNHYKELHISTDLSRMMRDIVGSLSAVPLRPKGGLYFIPESRHADLERLRQLLEGLPTQGNDRPGLYALGVVDRDQAKRQLARAVHTGLMQEVTAMQDNLQRFTTAKASTVKSQTIAERLLTYRYLKDKVTAYADLLGMQQEAIQRAISDMERQARSIILADQVDPMLLADKWEAERAAPGEPSNGKEPVEARSLWDDS
jgi:hypothetical protein